MDSKKQVIRKWKANRKRTMDTLMTFMGLLTAAALVLPF
jgi:hypothetical protein